MLLAAVGPRHRKDRVASHGSSPDKPLDFRKVTINDLPQSAVYLAGGRSDGIAVAVRADQPKTAALPAGLSTPARGMALQQ
jgi:hypothetical protein